MRLVSWNVNSLRSRAELVARFLADEQPDVLALQETKCDDARFPWRLFEDAGYEVIHSGRGGHAGVALASRVGLTRAQYGFAGEHGPPFDEPRLVAAECADVRVVSVYVPNGQRARSLVWQAKLAWLELLRIELELELLTEPELVVLGDLNVCPTPFDLYRPEKRNRNLVTDEERSAVQRLLEVGLVDLARHLHPNEPGYTWFSFGPDAFEERRGYRLDMALASRDVSERARSCRPALAWREPERSPSDHAPLVVELE